MQMAEHSDGRLGVHQHAFSKFKLKVGRIKAIVNHHRHLFYQIRLGNCFTERLMLMYKGGF
jgi:hypothetical protein